MRALTTRDAGDRARATADLPAEGLLSERMMLGPREQAAHGCDLLERTAYGRHIAAGPSGEQRLARLRELCFHLGHLAETEALPFNEVTARARDWVERPVALDPPHPVHASAVQILTIHQAKGLEFPVVLLWDGRGEFRRRSGFNTALRQDRTATAWHLGLKGCDHEHPENFGLQDRERAYENAALQRLVYVAATRTRDLLVIPKPDTEPNPKYIPGTLLTAAPEGSVRELAAYGDDAVPHGDGWWNVGDAKPGVSKGDESKLETHIEQAWSEAAGEAANSGPTPMGVVQAATRAVPEASADTDHETEGEPEAQIAISQEGSKPEPSTEGTAKWTKKSRYGPNFGIAVHRALELLLSGRVAHVGTALARAVKEAGLREHLDEARSDVERSLKTLKELGIEPKNGAVLRLEYPVAGLDDNGHLLAGSVDLLTKVGEKVFLIDFKTAQPPEAELTAAHQTYARQLKYYESLLSSNGMPPLRSYLLFTFSGTCYKL